MAEVEENTRQEIPQFAQRERNIFKYNVYCEKDNSDKEYEYISKMATLLCLRCAQDEEETWIAVNVADFKTFNDIILNQGGITYMIQSIQRDLSKGVASEEFLTRQGLQKYSERIIELKQCLDTGSKQGDWPGSFDNLRFVLFSNTNFKYSESLIRKCNNDLLRNLRIGTTTKIYILDTPLLPSNFNLNNFFLCTYMTNLDLDENIIKELKEIMINVPSVQPYIREVAAEFSEFITKWSHGYNNQTYCLTKQDIICKITELFFSKYQVKLERRKFRFRESPKKNLWSEIVQNKTLVVIDHDDNVRIFVNEYLGSRVRKYCKEPAGSWMAVLSAQNKNLLYQEYEWLEPQLARIVDDVNTITFADVYKCLWLEKQLPVLLEVKTMEDYNDILNIMKFSNYYYNVLILNKSGEELSFVGSEKFMNTFYSLADLDDTGKQKVLKQPVKLQGRSDVTLRTLLDDCMFHYIKCMDIINIFLGNFNIGTEIQPLPDYFIEPTVSKIYLSVDVLNEIKDELFLVGETSENRIRPRSVQQTTCKVNDLNFDKINEYRIITTTENFTENQIKKMRVLTGRAVHLLTVYDAKHLHWDYTYGSIKQIKEFRVELEDNKRENRLTTFKSDRIMIISGVAGTGKSLLLDYIAKQIEPTKWVFRINLREHQEYYETLKYRLINNADEHIRYFKNAAYGEHDSNSELTGAVFQKLLETDNIVFLLDGFDDVCSFFHETILFIVRSWYNQARSMWITTSPHLKSDFEDEFNTMAYSLKQFSKNEQKEFLTKYFRNLLDKNVVSQIVGGFENVLQVSKNTELTAKLIGTPLQVRLLADIFYVSHFRGKSIGFNENFNLLSLYQSFINARVRILSDKWVLTGQDELYCPFLALKLLFPAHKQELNNVCENRSLGSFPHFEHRSVAEYVAASWMFNNINSSNENIRELVKVLTLERFDAGYEFLFHIFDLLLAKNCLIHLAIINQQIEEAVKMIRLNPGLVNLTDEGGRTILHISALYGINHPLVFITGENFQSFKARKFLNSQNFKFDVMLDIIKEIPKNSSLFAKRDVLGYTPFDYALANGSLTIANKILGNVKDAIVINIDLSFNLKRDYIGYCAILNYRYLFNVLLSYFATRDLLSGKAHLFTSINDYIQYAYKYFEDCESILNYKINFRERNVGDLLRSHKANKYSGWLDGYYTNLSYAVSFGTPSNVATLLINGADVNLQYSHENAILHYAVYHARPAILELLLLKGAKLDAVNVVGNTPLHEAVKYSSTYNQRKINCVKLLISYGASVNAPNKFGRSAFHIASSLGDVDVLNALLSKPVDVNKPDNDGRIPLFYAVWNNKLEAVKLLMSNGANVNAQGGNGKTALHYATYYEYIEIVAEILSKTEDINKQDNSGNSALSIAALENNVDLITLLISQGANINQQNNEGKTALHLAAYLGYNDIVSLLIHNGADIEKRDCDGFTPLLGSILKHQVKIVHLLIFNGAKINAKQDDGKTALHISCAFGYNDIVKELLTQGVNINDQDNLGRTGLVYAMQEKQMNTARILINAGANINLQDMRGATGLHYAAFWGCTEILHEVVDKIDDVNKQDRNGATALFYATWNDKINVVQLLLANGGGVNTENKKAQTVLHAAVALDNSTILNELLSKGVDVNKQDVHGNTPLVLAAWSNKTDNVKLLLAADAEVGIESETGRTVLHAAARNGCDDILRQILSKSVAIDKQDQLGNTALLYAVQQNKINNVKLLIAADASVNLRNNNGVTVFQIARKNNFRDIMNHILIKWVSNPISWKTTKQ